MFVETVENTAMRVEYTVYQENEWNHDEHESYQQETDFADSLVESCSGTRRPDCVTEIRMGNSVLVVSGYFKKDTTTTAADKMARVLEAEAAATQEPTYPAWAGA